MDRRVSSDSRIAASPPMMRIRGEESEPAVGEFVGTVRVPSDMRGFPQQWKLKEKRRPKSHLTLDVDFARVLLNDAVRDGEAVAGALSGDAQGAALAGGRDRSGHGIFGIEKEVEEDLLQLAGIAHDAGKVGHEAGFDSDLRGLELMFEEGERV